MAARRSIAALVLMSLATIWPLGAQGQGPTVNPAPSMPGSTISRMGPIPGAGGMVLGNMPGADALMLGGRPGAFPRVQPSTGIAPGMIGRPVSRGIAAPSRLAASTFPVYGTLALPTTAEDEGPANGLTLDEALERLVTDNLQLRGLAFELPQAEADVLTASLRANPIFYADMQLIPYGHYTRDRPGGPTQADVNISHPFDVSGKRIARTGVARRAENLMQAQYQNAVRLQIDNLYTAFVDVLAARETVRLAKASVEGLDQVVKTAQTLYDKADATSVNVGRVRAQRASAEVGLDEARVNLQRSKQALAGLLSVPARQADSLEVRASIAPPEVSLPPVPELIDLTLQSRPDLVAQRLGVGHAKAVIDLARAERFHDIYVLYQPYTFQNNTPIGTKSPTSWALGASVPIPIFNRNQGAILRANLNRDQSEIELTDVERRAVAEVIQTEREYTITRTLLKQIEAELLPASRRMRDDALTLFTAGEIDSLAYFDRQKLYNDDVKQFRDMLVRHRRWALRLNTAVGRRILP